jgi:hypothetical protein
LTAADTIAITGALPIGIITANHESIRPRILGLDDTVATVRHRETETAEAAIRDRFAGTAASSSPTITIRSAYLTSRAGLAPSTIERSLITDFAWIELAIAAHRTGQPAAGFIALAWCAIVLSVIAHFGERILIRAVVRGIDAAIPLPIAAVVPRKVPIVARLGAVCAVGAVIIASCAIASAGAAIRRTIGIVRACRPRQRAGEGYALIALFIRLLHADARLRSGAVTIIRTLRRPVGAKPSPVAAVSSVETACIRCEERSALVLAIIAGRLFRGRRLVGIRFAFLQTLYDIVAAGFLQWTESGPKTWSTAIL